MIAQHRNAHAMARCLAEYMDCAVQIRSEVLSVWNNAPGIETIRKYRAQHHRAKRQRGIGDYDRYVTIADSRHAEAMRASSAMLLARIRESRGEVQC